MKKFCKQGYKQKHHFSGGGGKEARRQALRDITQDKIARGQPYSTDYLRCEPLVMSMSKYPLELIPL